MNSRVLSQQLGTTAKQAEMVWACAAKRRQWLGEEMCAVWSGPKGRQRKTWTEVVQKDCQSRKL